MHRPTTSRRIQLRLAIFTTVLSGVLAWGAWQFVHRNRMWSSVIVDSDGQPEQAWRGYSDLVVDRTAGFRARANTTVEGQMPALSGGTVEPFRRRHNNLGLIRNDDIEGEIPGPRILVLGDSHMMGVVNTEENAATLLEQRLRADERYPTATVLNAGCANYCFYQYVLRARALVDVLKPDLILVVVFMGNDFLGMEDTSIPHLDDQGEHREASANPPPETTSVRRKRLALTVDGMFWQGLNQAAYLHLHPDRVSVLERKIARGLDMMRELADEHGAALMYALLPSYDIVFPKHVAAANAFTLEIFAEGAQQKLYDWFRATLESRSEAVHDLQPAFRRTRPHELYAADLHIWRVGHRMLADGVFDQMCALLERRR